MEAITSSFNWERAILKDQYFQEEDFRTFENTKASLNTQLVRFQRTEVETKLLNLHELLKPFIKTLKLHSDPKQVVSSLYPEHHREHKLRGMWLALGRGETELKKLHTNLLNMMSIQIIILRKELGIWLVPGKPNCGKADREYFRNEMKSETFRKKFYDLFKALGDDYWIEIGGEKHKTATFKSAEQLEEHTSKDNLNNHFIIGRNYLPNHPDLSSAVIISTLQNEMTKLNSLYTLMKDNAI